MADKTGKVRRAGDLAALTLLAAAAFAVEPLAARRPEPASATRAGSLWVSSENDAGPGSLREALFAAAVAPERPRILLASRRVDAATPLPPLAHPEGLELAARARTEIAGAGDPVLDVALPGVELRGLTISGARTGVRLRAGGARLVELTLHDCEIGIAILAEAHRVGITGGSFERNGVGVQVAPRSAVAIEGNRFRDNDQGVRAVAPEWTPGDGLSIAGNRFSGDIHSVVLANVSATVLENTFDDAREAAVYLAGSGATVRRNRVQGAAIGILADAANGAEIADNDLLGNRRMGLLVRGGAGTSVIGNRLSDNAYGIVALFLDAAPATAFRDNRLERQGHDGFFLLAGSPALTGNRVTASGGAGLRLAEYVLTSGARRAPRPLLEGNVFEGNRGGRIVAGEYRQEPESAR